jgi:small subunit ribosomal protein S3Ae
LSKAAKKVKDKWRAKEWYDVYAPAYFGEKKVASIPCSDPTKLIGRVVETTLYDITNDFSHQSQKLYFLAVNVKGVKVETILKSHEYSADYLRSLVRRGSSRIDAIFNVTSKDQYVTRASVVAFTRDRVNANQQHLIRSIMRKTVEEKAATLAYDQLCHEMVLGIFGSEVYNLAKKVSPLRHVGVRKSKLLVIPEGVVAKPAEILAQAKAAQASGSASGTAS